MEYGCQSIEPMRLIFQIKLLLSITFVQFESHRQRLVTVIARNSRKYIRMVYLWLIASHIKKFVKIAADGYPKRLLHNFRLINNAKSLATCILHSNESAYEISKCN